MALLKQKTAPKPLELQKFGLASEAEWLLIAPSRYEDYLNEITDFRRLVAGNAALVRGTIVKKILYTDTKQKTTNIHVASRLLAFIKNALGQEIPVIQFGRPGYMWHGFDEGAEVLLYATPQPQRDPGQGLCLTNPSFADPDKLGRICPVYPSVKQTKGSRLAEAVTKHEHLLDIAANLVEAELGWHDPQSAISISELTGFPGAYELICALHDPDSLAHGERARRAAKLVTALAMIRKARRRAAAVEPNPRSIIPLSSATVASLKKSLPYPLTKDQDTAIDGICASIRSPQPMSGLLSGDVGSGKTVTFLVPMVAAYMSGKRAILMTPNLLLIQQVADEVRQYFPGIPVCTITGDGIVGDPSNAIIIGNTALFSAIKKKKISGVADFLVIDEQHKFSVEQRKVLSGRHTNVLEATATPIPRTTALITHAEKDLYILHEIPVKKEINATILGKDDAKNARQEILDAIYTRGEQAAVIYPLVSTANPEKARKAVTEAAEHWAKHMDPADIVVLHGKMEDNEKTEALKVFKSGRAKLLLATTVIEVGMTVPALKTMLVIDADKLGVVTLHQLRGRLARHGGKGLFMMYAEDPAEESLERLQLLVDHSDGFALAEKDAESRGYGDFLSNEDDAQSGITKGLFLGVKVGPREIGYANDVYDAAQSTPAPLPVTAPPAPAQTERVPEVSRRRVFN